MKKVAKKAVKKKRIPASRGPKAGGARKLYTLPDFSRDYGKRRKWPVADWYQKTGKVRAPKEGEVFLGSDGEAIFAAFNFPVDTLFEILKPVREVPRPKGRK